MLPIKTKDSPDAILGVWQNASGKGHIQIYKQGNYYFGKIIWLKNPVDADGKPKVDKHNSDPNDRNNPLIGLVMLKHFTYKDNEWTDGHIYNPQDGKEYKGYIKMPNSNTIVIRAYIGFSWIGKSDTWTRVR